MIQQLIAYLIITVGCSFLWSTSEIFMPIRNLVAKYFPLFLRKMLLCMECSSFWIGIFISILIFPYPYPFYNNYLFSFLLQAVCGGISTYLVIKLLTNLNLISK